MQNGHVSIRISARLKRRLEELATVGGTTRTHVMLLALAGVCVPDSAKLRTVRGWQRDADRRRKKSG